MKDFFDIINFQTIKAGLKKDRILFAIRIICGSLLAITIATTLKIDFAPSTGIITLLTVDQTQLATLKRTILRICSFLYTFAITWVALDVLNLGDSIGFALALSLVTLITFILRWDLTLSVNCVILNQLFLQRIPFGLHLFINESERILIGLFCALFINFIFRVKRGTIEDAKLENLKGL